MVLRCDYNIERVGKQMIERCTDMMDTIIVGSAWEGTFYRVEGQESGQEAAGSRCKRGAG